MLRMLDTKDYYIFLIDVLCRKFVSISRSLIVLNTFEDKLHCIVVNFRIVVYAQVLY